MRLEMRLIGRDKLLSKDIYPRLKKNTAFILVGQRGIGKSSLLKWSYGNYQGDKLYLSCRDAYGLMLRKIAKSQGLNGDRMKLSDLEHEIIKGKKIALFIDDVERMTPKQAGFFTSLNEIWSIYLSGVEPFREELKRITWGKQKIQVNPLSKDDRLKLAEVCIQETGSLVSRNLIASECKGVPARAWAIARGEAVKEEAERVEGEEINIAPVLLVGVAAIMVMRYIGLGLGEKDLYLLGGIGMGAAVFLRYFIFQGMRK